MAFRLATTFSRHHQMITGTVFNIQRFSIHDGPGIRSTVFLKGCPLSCLWCHNPEGISPFPELLYHESRCNLCLDCLPACPTGALSVSDGRILVDDGLCDQCGRCQNVCMSEALEVAGREMTVDGVMAQIAKDIVFYDQSGGGVTFSGGEPLRQSKFLLELLRRCREQEIHTALDTTGFAPAELIETVAPLVDLFLFDLKAMDEQRHRELTGVPNTRILSNLGLLISLRKSVVIRVPLIPGLNDHEENINALGELVRDLNPGQRVDVLPYHSIAMDKYRRLHRDYRLSDIRPPSAERLSQVVSSLEGFGLAVKIGG